MYKIILVILLLFSVANAAELKEISGKAIITDGDTIKINGEKIRLLYIDAPEKKQQCCLDGSVWMCGVTSKDALINMIEDKIVTCSYSKRDRYGRILGNCSTDNFNINQEMVKTGMALVYHSRNKKGELVTKDKNFMQDEEEAARNKAGIWNSNFVYPYDWRKGKKISCLMPR